MLHSRGTYQSTGVDVKGVGAQNCRLVFESVLTFDLGQHSPAEHNPAFMPSVCCSFTQGHETRTHLHPLPAIIPKTQFSQSRCMVA